jgi:hypothetical protein
MLCKWLRMKLRMKFSVGYLQCRPAEAVPLLRIAESNNNVFRKGFEQRDELSFQNECSDDV